MKLLKLMIVVISAFFILFSSIYVSSATVTMTATPILLNENGLNGAIITLIISGTDFRQGGALIPTNYKLNNAPTGLVIANTLKGADNKTVFVVLEFDGTNFAGDITNFSITVLAPGTIQGVSATSNSITLKDNNVIATMSAKPNILYEPDLNGTSVELVLTGTDFKQNTSDLVPSNFLLNNAPAGLVIANIFKEADTKRVLVLLAFDGTDINGDINNFSISALPGAVVSSKAITSNSMTIRDILTVGGTGQYRITGEAYPSNIEVAGFNSKSRYLYLNIELYTTKTVGITQPVTFYYYIKVFDQTSNELAHYGDFSAPKNITATGTNTVSLRNIEIFLPNLSPEFRIVVFVKSVSTS